MNKKEQTGIFVRITKGKADKRLNKEVKEFIKKKQREYGGELSKEEKKELRQQYISGHRRKIIKEEAKKAKIKVAALGMASMLGIGAVGGYVLGSHNSKILGITDGKEKIEINMNEVEKNVEIQNLVNEEGKTSKHDIFVQGLKDQAFKEEIKRNEEIAKETEKEINELTTSDKIQEYVKELYVNEYNSQNEQQINKNNVKLYKNTENKVFYTDKAQNGEEILRCCSENEAQEKGIAIRNKKAEISVEIGDEQGLQSRERVGFNGEKCMTVYGPNEEVAANEHTILCDLGKIVLYGIDTATSMDQEGTSIQNKANYKEKFIKAVTEYKQTKAQNTQNTNVQTQKNDDELEIVD